MKVGKGKTFTKFIESNRENSKHTILLSTLTIIEVAVEEEDLTKRDSLKADLKMSWACGLRVFQVGKLSRRKAEYTHALSSSNERVKYYDLETLQLILVPLR